MVGGFAGIIVTGTILLLLPISSNNGQVTPLVDALFTATSGVCVTGLVVVDTGTYWSPFGQAVILGLIQIGGLGFMTSSTLLFLLIGRRITLRERLLIGKSLGMPTLGGLVGLIKQIAIVTIAIEGAGVLLLFFSFSVDHSPATALWWAMFHAVSAFNNAGFDIMGNFRSLTDYQANPLVLVPIVLLLILGGISFTVIVDVVKVRRFRRLTLDSRLVLVMAASLLVLGTIIVLLAEYSNPDSLGAMSLPAKFMNAFFLSATPRTAGFTPVIIGELASHTLFLLIALMFIGGASGSTAGGIKINTVSVLLAAILCSIRGKEHVEAFGKELPEQQIHRSLVIAVLAISLVFTVVLFLSVIEGFSFINLLFETVSAFGTVGLSTGITPSLSILSRLFIIITMFVGRLGPLTMALTLVQRQERGRYRYPQEMVKIG